MTGFQGRSIIENHTAAVLIAVVVSIATVSAQPGRAAPPAPTTPGDDAAERPMGTGGELLHEFVMPVGSVLIPGFGQVGHRAWGAGLGFFSVWLGGSALFVKNHIDEVGDDELPRDAESQLGMFGGQLAFAAGLISSYDSFQRSLPDLRRAGKYRFLESPATTRSLWLAPVDFRYLRSWKTLVVLGVPVGVVVAAAIIDARDDIEHVPFKARDALWSVGTSYNAGVGEEAFFRGYLYPVLQEMFDQSYWVANALQASIFAAAHLGSVDVPIAQLLAGGYFGWVTTSRGWDIREAAFQHFWWDAILITAALALDEAPTSEVRLLLPEIRF